MSKKSKIKTVVFEGVGEFLAASNTENIEKTSHREGNEDFYGTTTYGEALELAKRGWPEGVERLQALRAELEQVVDKAITAKAARLNWDVTGDFLDVGRYLGGEPEVFGSYVDDAEAHGQTRVVKLVANVSAIGSVKTESIFSAGAAVFAAVDILESLGHRVELWLGSGSEGNYGANAGKRLQVLTLIKEASQPFDADRVAFWLCSNASLRRLHFSLETDLGFAPDYSRTTPLELEEGAVVTPEVKWDDDTRAKRIERVIEVCKRCGVAFSQEEREAIVS